MIKKLILLSILFGLFLVSCNKQANQETVKAMADEMCHAMSLINEDDPMSFLETQSALILIREKQEKGKEYFLVTDKQLQEVMKSICPKGLDKYVKMVAGEEE